MSHGAVRERSRRYISDLVMAPMIAGSEDQLQGELDPPRGIGGADGAEGGTGGLGVRYPEIRVVRNVEELRPELQPDLFHDPEVLVDREIPLIEVGGAERISADIPVRRAGRRCSECVPGEIGIQHGGAALDDGTAGYVGAQERLAAIIVGKGTDDVGTGGTVGHVEWLARVSAI